MADKIDELKAALEGMEGMLDEKLKMMLAFVEFLKKQDKKNKKRSEDFEERGEERANRRPYHY